jgi:TRAP-type C4-dicarboxylate transport system permease small subunit
MTTIAKVLIPVCTLVVLISWWLWGSYSWTDKKTGKSNKNKIKAWEKIGYAAFYIGGAAIIYLVILAYIKL